MQALTVINDFGKYKKGDQIKDLEELKEILAGHSAGSVVRVNLPDAPAEEPKSE